MVGRRATQLGQITPGELAKRLKRACDQKDKRFAFLLGAGCSISSGIPAAGQLVRSYEDSTDWLRQLHELMSATTRPGEIDDWAREELALWDPDNPAAVYGELISRLFLHAGDRQREIERICDNPEKVYPRFGYAMLSAMMAMPEGFCNVVLTTNFDDLVADAAYYYQQIRPLIIQHDSLAPFIRPTRQRPMVVKLHGDYQLEPRNLENETDILDVVLSQRVNSVLHDRGLIIVGYGGNDESIIGMLEELPAEALPFGVYWVSDREPQGIFRPWLEERGAIWVKHRDFDELMLLFKCEFAIDDPDPNRFTKMDEQYCATKENLIEGILKQGEHALASIQAAAWRMYASAAHELSKKDVGKADEKFREGLIKCPGSPELHHNYAIFLFELCDKVDKDENYKNADKLFRKAIELAPKYALILGHYALFQKNALKNPDKAEEYYKKAIECDPGHSTNLSNYAIFLNHVRREYSKAEDFYLKAIESNPKNPEYHGNYAQLLFSQGRNNEARKVFVEAQVIHKNAPDDRLTVELSFYAYADYQHNGDPQLLTRLRELLEAGVRSPDWDLSMNVKQAVKDGHPAKGWLKKISLVVSDKAKLTTLKNWKAWQQCIKN